MKRFYLMTIVICFVLSGTLNNFAQTRKNTKKSVKKTLVKCYENGKQVYRTKCRTPRTSNPELVIAPQTKVKKDKEIVQNPSAVISDGQGVGGGMGTGRGSGGGYGVGNGAGNGNTTEETIPKTSNSNKGLTTPLKLLSKPSAQYTDAARQNNVNGTVVLRVTFLANGAIGAISVISTLPHGLTEQAIVAAKKIQFEPAKRNGVPYTVTKAINYNFSIY